MSHRLKQVDIRLKQPDVSYMVKRFGSIMCSQQAVDLTRIMLPEYREFMAAINMTARGKPVNIWTVTMGTARNSMTELVQHIIRSAILSNACSVILVSNHIEVNKELQELAQRTIKKMFSVGKKLGIFVQDYVVLEGGNDLNYYSCRENGFDPSQTSLNEDCGGLKAAESPEPDYLSGSWNVRTEAGNAPHFPEEFTSVRLVPVPGGIPSNVPVKTLSDAREAAMGFMGELDREHFCTVSLNERNKPVNFCVLSVGTIKEALISVVDAFKPALLSKSNKVVFFHNHPSGDVSPSEPDIDSTYNLILAGRLLGIDVVDHIIVGSSVGVDRQAYYSFKEDGIIARYEEKAKLVMKVDFPWFDDGETARKANRGGRGGRKL